MQAHTYDEMPAVASDGIDLQSQQSGYLTDKRPGEDEILFNSHRSLNVEISTKPKPFPYRPACPPVPLVAGHSLGAGDDHGHGLGGVCAGWRAGPWRCLARRCRRDG